MGGREVTVTTLEKSIERLEARVREATERLRALGEENARLRAALAAARGGEEDASHTPVRVRLLEAEREQVRGRLRGLLEAL